MRLVIGLTFIAIIAIYVWQMVLSYRELAQTGGSLWQHLLAAAWGSATKLWAKSVGIVASLIGYVATMTDWLNAPQITALIKQYADPQWIVAIMAALFLLTTFVTEWARGRTLDKS